MAASAPVLTIQEFLLVHVVGDGEPGDRAGSDPMVHGPRFKMSAPEGLALTGAELRVEINRHNDRTMTVPRRRVLRELGISISRSDFSDEELAQRGIAVEQSAPPTD